MKTALIIIERVVGNAENPCRKGRRAAKIAYIQPCLDKRILSQIIA